MNILILNYFTARSDSPSVQDVHMNNIQIYLLWLLVMERMQPEQQLAMGWTVPSRGKIFQTPPDWPPGTPSLLYNWYQVSSPEVKWLGHGNDHPHTLLTFRHRASSILGQAFHYCPENAFYFNQQIYSLSDICLTVHH